MNRYGRIWSACTMNERPLHGSEFSYTTEHRLENENSPHSFWYAYSIHATIGAAIFTFRKTTNNFPKINWEDQTIVHQIVANIYLLQNVFLPIGCCSLNMLHHRRMTLYWIELKDRDQNSNNKENITFEWGKTSAVKWAAEQQNWCFVKAKLVDPLI